MHRSVHVLLIACALAAGIHASQLPPQLPRNLRVSAADSTPPVCAITAPTSSATYDNGAVSSITTIAGTITDNVAVSTNLTWSNSLTGGSGSGTVSGSSTSETWSIASISLSSGDNPITVTCRDSSGNTHTDTITVTYTPSGGSAPAVDVLFYSSFTGCSGDLGRMTTSSWRFGSVGGIVPTQCPADIDNGNVNIGLGLGQCTDGLSGGGGSDCVGSTNATNDRKYSVVDSTGNCTTGKGGRGLGIWIGQSVNGPNYSGGVSVKFNEASPLPEVYIRWCVNWSTDIKLGGTGDGSPYPVVREHKSLYFSGTGCQNGTTLNTGCYWDLVFDHWRMGYGSTSDHCGTGWTGIMGSGSAYSDGQDHWFELRVKRNSVVTVADGEIEFQVDGVTVCDLTNVKFNTATSPGSQGFTEFVIPSNGQWSIMGSGATDSAPCNCPAFDRRYKVDDVLVHLGPGFAGAYQAGRANGDY